jgi:peptidoglycan/LPS O-acetylase OafA/YrhL
MHLAFDTDYLGPANETGARPYLFQLPFLRLIGAGNTAVALFFLLSGFVCSLKPLRFARAGQYEEAWSCIASSAFRRIIRLCIPATLVTVIAWILAQCNAFALAHSMQQPFDWLQNTSALHIPGFWAPLHSLWDNCVYPSSKKLMKDCNMVG